MVAAVIPFFDRKAPQCVELSISIFFRESLVNSTEKNISLVVNGDQFYLNTVPCFRGVCNELIRVLACKNHELTYTHCSARETKNTQHTFSLSPNCYDQKTLHAYTVTSMFNSNKNRKIPKVRPNSATFIVHTFWASAWLTKNGLDVNE